jgi:DNA-directed DNA polymerase III PolC
MIEWCASSCFSFLEGASMPEALLASAHNRGYAGIGIADRMSLSGLVQGLRGAERNREQSPHFFYAPGIRLHFDHAEPLLVYPLHRAAHARLCRHLSNWALSGMHGAEREKGLTPLRWREFLRFLADTPQLAQDYVLISVNGRFYPWIAEARDPERVRTQDAAEPGPSLSRPPTTPQHCPLWLLELRDVCGTGPDSALSLAYPLTSAPGAEDLLDWLEEQSFQFNIPLLATTMPLFARQEDRELCELVTAIRHTKPLQELGYLAQANADRRLLSPTELELRREVARERFRRFFARKAAVRREHRALLLNDPFRRGFDLAERHHFSLFELRYRYPRERIPPGVQASDYLRQLVFEGAQERYPEGIPPDSLRQIEHELNLVRTLEYEDYFLTIWDILRYARERNILFQGRGSAANSVLCFCLGITAIDPVRMELLFERFMSLERHEPPDIDVDFEHERREEVLQEVYRRYGREHAAMVTNYICFRDRMAARETAKALGLPAASLEDLVRLMGREGLRRLTGRSKPTDAPALANALAEQSALHEILQHHRISVPLWEKFLELSDRLRGLPRHLGIHPGGFVLSSERLSEQCVLEPARMADRSIVPWDKDDVDFLGWMKVDLLSLGMLTAIHKALDHVNQRLAPNATLTLARVPAECPQVYEAMCRADTVGVFQIESRAQMNMLPRLAPRNFYDIVVEVAIVRPGPLQGGMVHPYIRRRQGIEPTVYEHEDLRPILAKTLGVPIFQEQVMKIAVAVAGFTPGEADILRKHMSGAWRMKSKISELKARLLTGMTSKGISVDLCERLYRQIEGFGEYGFPESHAASFALLTYVSTWLKVHYPAEFLCALLNSQPMGFYAPRSLVLDAERHGVTVRALDIAHSRWDATLESNPCDPSGRPAVRLGLALIRGLSREDAARIEALQARGVLSPEHEAPPLRTLRDLGLSPRALEALVRAKACADSEESYNATTDPRRAQMWRLLSLRQEEPAQPLLHEGRDSALTPFPQNTGDLPPLDEWNALLMDYRHVGLAPGRHPATYARKKLFAEQRPWITAEQIYRLRNGARCTVLGLLSIKQRPPTAGGFTFLTLEDETGFFNLVLIPEVYERTRLMIEGSPLLVAEGVISRSVQLDPQDPHTAAVSLQVRDLWNPFVKLPPNEAVLGPRSRKDLYRPRHYH